MSDSSDIETILNELINEVEWSVAPKLGATSVDRYKQSKAKYEAASQLEAMMVKEKNKVLESIGEPTINDVFPSKPYDGTNTHKDMVQVVTWYKNRIASLKSKLELRGEKL